MNERLSRLCKAAIVTLAVIAGLVVAWLLLPPFGEVSKRGTNTVSVAHGKQVWQALRLYANDHGDRLPESLQQLSPDYLPGALGDYEYCDRNYRSPRRHPWLYFPRPALSAAPQTHILFAAPFAVPFGEPPKQRRLVFYCSSEFDNILEDDYQSRVARELSN
jgi:hypothetical protein